jgi:hypothetical protein
LVAFPLYQHQYRGENYELTASDIITRTHQQPLYITDVTTNGLNVAAYINQKSYPQQTLQFPPATLDSGFVISMTAEPEPFQIVKEYQLGRDKLYLLCHGSACTDQLTIK